MWEADHRTAFAGFLDRLARNADGPGEWFKFVVAHYRDEELEETRILLVRLSIERDPYGCPQWLETDRDQMRRWAAQLRRATDIQPTPLPTAAAPSAKEVESSGEMNAAI